MYAQMKHFSLQLWQRGLQRSPDFIKLCRLDKPIGIFLLLWPAFWALWLASGGIPAFATLIIFGLGVILTRSAGCVINDYADRNIDGAVQRTKDRPIPSGAVSATEALIFAACLTVAAFILVLFTNPFTVALSVVAVFLAASYPFLKRYTYMPQLGLGAAFAWSVPMAFAAVNNELAREVWLIYLAVVLWTVAYDTQYAMVDRDDDIKIGVKSTAILFGDLDNFIILLLQGSTLMCLFLLGKQLQLAWPYYLGLGAAICLFTYQATLTKNRQREACFEAFLNNHWVGAVIFLGIALSYL